MIKTLLFHPGTQYSHQLAKQLYKRNLLFLFISGFIISEKSILLKCIRKYFPNLHRKISNRVIKELPPSKLKSFLFHEIFSLIKLRNRNTEINYFERNNLFQKKIPESILINSSIIIGFDTSSFLLIAKAIQLNKPFILDVSIAHSVEKNIVYRNLTQLFPNWADFIELKDEKLIEMEQQEFLKATKLVVASNFTKQTLINQGVCAEKIHVNPYGINLTDFKMKEQYLLNQKIKFIFIGLVDARKGVPFLLNVMGKLDPNLLELNLVGPVSSPIKSIIESNYSSLPIKIFGKVPHAEMSELVKLNDVFVFPTYFEGFGLVILEAMASGLPVITTTASAGADIVQNGIEGFVIEPGNEKELKKAMQYFIDHPKQIEIMGKAARLKAEQYTWDSYGKRWEKIITEVLHN
jgi:glycosyltransferase involved in cell wall biosynthesis